MPALRRSTKISSPLKLGVDAFLPVLKLSRQQNLFLSGCEFVLIYFAPQRTVFAQSP